MLARQRWRQRDSRRFCSTSSRLLPALDGSRLRRGRAEGHPWTLHWDGKRCSTTHALLSYSGSMLVLNLSCCDHAIVSFEQRYAAGRAKVLSDAIPDRPLMTTAARPLPRRAPCEEGAWPPLFSRRGLAGFVPRH